MNVTQKIDTKFNGPPDDYSPIAKIRGAMFHWICVPWNMHVVGNEPIWLYLTCLNAIAIKSCGDISCLYFPKKEDENKEFDIYELIERKNAQENLVKLVMVNPSFDNVIFEITKINFIISEKREELNKINQKIKNAPNGKEKVKLEKEAERVEFYLGFPLPDDTMGFLTAWALGVEITDIKKVSKDMLLDAAILASNGHDNPTDHISGVFTDFQKEDINKHAWIIYNEFQEEKKREKALNKSNKW